MTTKAKTPSKTETKYKTTAKNPMKSTSFKKIKTSIKSMQALLKQLELDCKKAQGKTMSKAKAKTKQPTTA